MKVKILAGTKIRILRNTKFIPIVTKKDVEVEILTTGKREYMVRLPTSGYMAEVEKHKCEIIS